MYTLQQFLLDYPDNQACLEEIKQRKFKNFACPNCSGTKLYPVKGRKTYACGCGYQVSPLKDTIFEHSSTPLTSWFYVIYIFSQTKSGVSACQIQRELGVTYKCAWRMCHKVRELMVADLEPLSGDVEADETYFKAKPWRNTRVRRGGAQVLVAVVQRGGAVKVTHVPKNSSATIERIVKKQVTSGSTLHTDGSNLYRWARETYTHNSLVHWRPTEPKPTHKYDFIAHDVPNTQYIEGFFSQMKPRFIGVYRHCDPKYLQKYANEYAWRYSNRKSDVPLFRLLLDRL